MFTNLHSRFLACRLFWAVVMCLALLTGTALAQLPMPASTQFDITGFLQEATLDGNGTGALQGGHLKVNGHLITVPANTIVILPANALTWAELFTQAPAPYGPTQTGMAMSDSPGPLTTYEVHVVGNRVLNGSGGPDLYIAGLIDIAQQGLNSGAGFINWIDYTLGEMRVGGTIGDATTGTRVRINDPNGRYGLNTTSPDIRFTVDPDNPTIMAGTGYPMCLARTAPLVDPTTKVRTTTDTQCPEENRPQDLAGNFASSFTTNNLTNPAFAINTGFPNSTFQAPFEVGDYVTYSGTLVQDCFACASGGTTAGPWPASGTASTWISAHTIVNNVAIYTWPGSNPAYVMTEVTLIGTGGLTVLGAGEAAIRTRFEGMTTDSSRVIHLYGMDYSVQADGSVVQSDRDFGYIGVDPGPAGGVGAVQGRWRFRPPCTATISTFDDKKCSPPPAGTFLPPPREVRAVLEVRPGSAGVSAWTKGNDVLYANGLIAGQYHAPILEYIFPENIPGTPIVENNFNALDFLAKGGYSSSAGTVAGVLDPWPSTVVPPPVGPQPPSNVVLSASASTVASGGTITLTASASGATPMTYAFAQSGAAGVFGTPSPDGSQITWTAPVNTSGAPVTTSFSVTATNGQGTATSAAVAVATNSAQNPTVSVTAPLTVTSGAPVTLTATCNDPNGAAAQPCTITWTQTGGTPIVLSPNPKTGSSVSFSVSLPIGTTTSTTLSFQVVASDAFGLSSAPATTSVTITPQADVVTIGSAEYRIGKQRLIILAGSNVAGVTLTLQPYVTESGTTFDPGSFAVFDATGTLTLVGAPPPACKNTSGTYTTPCTVAPLTVKSSLGGVSLPSALTRIRQ